MERLNLSSFGWDKQVNLNYVGLYNNICELSPVRVEKQTMVETTEEPEAGPPKTLQQQLAVTHHGKLIVDATACPQDMQGSLSNANLPMSKSCILFLFVKLTSSSHAFFRFAVACNTLALDYQFPLAGLFGTCTL